MQDQPIIWLASYPKSGNTWLRMFLAAYATDMPVNINHLPKMFGISDQQAGPHQMVSPYQLNDMTYRGVMAIRSAALLYMAASGGTVPAFIKTHWPNVTAWGVEALPEVLTRKAVVLVRDPRDVCVSMARHMNHSLDEQIRFMLDGKAAMAPPEALKVFTSLGTWESWMGSWHGELKFPVMMVRYEDMVDRPEEAFAEIIQFLDMWEFDRDRLKRTIDNTAFPKLRGQEDRDGFCEARNGVFFGSGSPGGWKEVLTPEQAARFDTLPLGKYGYEGQHDQAEGEGRPDSEGRERDSEVRQLARSA